MRFQYEALGADGRTVHGVLDAPAERDAAEALRTRALFVLRLKPEAAAAARGRSWRGGRAAAAEVALFLRQLALSLRSGVTLLQTLEGAAREGVHPALAAVAGRVAERIRAGSNLSGAMAKERIFPPVAVRLIASGEATGELDPVLDRIADWIERRAELRRSLYTSLAYPTVVTLVAIGVAIFLVVGVVPKFASFLARRELALPWTTQALMDVAEAAHRYGPYALGALAVAAAATAYASMTRRGRLAIDRTLLRVPLVGAVLRIASLAQIAWTLGALLRSGVAVVDAVRLTAAATPNRALARRLESAAEAVLSGQPLSAGLGPPLVPAVVRSLVASGERTGAMTDVLGELAEFYSRELALRIRRLASLVEPALIVLVGGLVGFVYLAFFHALVRLAGR